MVLHHADVNRRRELRGEHPVNGLWLWGGGLLPERVPCPGVEVCPGDDLSRGVGLHAGCGLVAAEDAVGRPGVVLRADTSLQRSALNVDADAWWAALADIERSCGAVLRALAQRRLDALAIDSCEGTAWRVDRAALRRFWRPPRGALRRLLGQRAGA
jgi:hypothetical protein